MLQIIRNSICFSSAEIDSIALKWKEKWVNKIPESFFRNQLSRDGNAFHVTIVNKASVKEIADRDVSSLLQKLQERLNTPFFVDIGVGKVSDSEGSTAYYVLLLNSQLTAAVKELCGLDIECFHVTLGFAPFDVHTVPKSVSTLQFDSECSRMPSEQVVDEVKAIAKRGHFENALKVARLFDASNCAALLDLISLLQFKLGMYDESIEVALKLMNIADSSSSFKGNLRAAESYLKKGEILDAAICLAKCVSLSAAENSSVRDYLKLLISKCMLAGIYRIDLLPVSRKLLKEDDAIATLKDEKAALAFSIFNSMTTEQKRTYQQFVAEASLQYGPIELDKLNCPLPLECRNVTASMYVLPRNFSWLWPEKLAIMSTPRNAKDIEELSKLGINLVVTLTEEEPLSAEWFKPCKSNCRNLFLPTPNYNPTSSATADELIWQVAKAMAINEKVLVHCGGGKGRAGTAAAVIMIALGMNPNSLNLCLRCRESFVQFGSCQETDCCMSFSPQMDPAWTLSTLRSMRPESLETEAQVDFLKSYSALIWSRIAKRDQSSNRIEESDENLLQVAGSLPPQTPMVIVTVGLPGSGKSTFCQKLIQSYPDIEFIHVNQDAIGGKKDFESSLSSAGKSLGRAGKKSIVLVDKCNPTIEDRKLVLDILGNPSASKAVCLHFDIPAELCESRIDRRFDHPTIPAGKGKNPIEHFAKLMQSPSPSEGFCAVLHVKTRADVDKAMSLLFGSSAPQSEATGRLENFFKFPRTPHLFDLGAATRDDLILSSNDLTTFFAPAAGKVITMEEKVDGANLGFSINDEGKIMAQNRSHYVDSKHHPQFQKLGSYIFQKQADLEFILCGGTRILYGEWLYAKHSIHYTKLPDYFIAFDIFDIEEKRFLDRETFYNLLDQTSISYVKPLVDNCASYNSREALTNLIKKTQSRFSESLIEGVYFRWDQDGRLKTRAKLVRQDFIAGNDHWSKGMIQPNIIVKEN